MWWVLAALVALAAIEIVALLLLSVRITL